MQSASHLRRSGSAAPEQLIADGEGPDEARDMRSADAPTGVEVLYGGGRQLSAARFVVR